MFIPFDSLPEHARIWIYQADRPFAAQEQDIITACLTSFCHQWTAHNQPLQASFALRNDHFIILGVDEAFNEASGCSIDTSVREMTRLAHQLSIDFFNRTKVGFWINNRVELVDLKALAQKRDEGFWNADTPIFNTTAATVGELKSRWLLSSADTWLSRYLKKQTA
jgi:hypothetical protein